MCSLRCSRRHGRRRCAGARSRWGRSRQRRTCRGTRYRHWRKRNPGRRESRSSRRRRCRFRPRIVEAVGASGRPARIPHVLSAQRCGGAVSAGEGHRDHVADAVAVSFTVSTIGARAGDGGHGAWLHREPHEARERRARCSPRRPAPSRVRSRGFDASKDNGSGAVREPVMPLVSTSKRPVDASLPKGPVQALANTMARAVRSNAPEDDFIIAPASPNDCRSNCRRSGRRMRGTCTLRRPASRDRGRCGIASRSCGRASLHAPAWKFATSSRHVRSTHRPAPPAGHELVVHVKLSLVEDSLTPPWHAHTKSPCVAQSTRRSSTLSGPPQCRRCSTSRTASLAEVVDERVALLDERVELRRVSC